MSGRSIGNSNPEEPGESSGVRPAKAWPFLLLGMALFAIGVAAWRPVPAGVWHDDGVYMLVGKALAEGRGLVYAGVVDTPPATKFPPVYPLFLAGLWALFGAIGPVTLAATVANLVFLAVAGALFARALLAGSGLVPTVAVVVTGLAFASTDVLRAGLIPLSESLFLLLLSGALVLWPRAAARDRKALAALAAVLLTLVATRTAGLAVVVAFAISLGLKVGLGPMAAATAPAVAFAGWWSWWSDRASAAIPEGARDLLGPYGRWLVDQTLGAPATFLANLPAHAHGVVERAAALTFPGVTGSWLWPLAALVAPFAAYGLYLLVRRFPPLGWYGVVYLVVLLVWPYLDRRLIVPWHPVLLTAAAVGGAEVLRRARVRWGARSAVERVVLGCAVVWLLAYTSISAGRIAEGWPTAPYRLRSDRLAASVEALGRTAPADAVVGAPEFWAALHLHGGWTVSPSVRFDPRRVDAETPMWGTADEQLELWRTMGIDHLLLEQSGVLHDAALDQLEESCPGSVFILARMSTSMIVRLDWESECATG